MTHRMVAAAASLVGLFVALYLTLWRLGLMGSLACTTRGCEAVQTSRYAVFWGVPVAYVGLGGFALLLFVSLLGLQPRWRGSATPTLALVLLSCAGTAFAAYLTWLEAFVIRAWCSWCVAAAMLILIVFAASLAGLRGRPR